MATAGVAGYAFLVLTLLQAAHAQQVADCGIFPEVVLILDSSGSIVDKGAGNWQLMRQFGINTINLLQTKPDIRFSYISFSTTAVVHTQLTRDAEAVKNAIRASPHMGGFTNQADALKEAQNVLLSARAISSKYVVIVTDGSPTLNIGDESLIAAQLRQQGVLNIAVGVTNQINRTNLLDIVGNNMGYLFLRSSFSQLDNAFSELIAVALSACPPPPGECNEPDIVICIDASGSITESNTLNWGYMTMFIARLATQLFSDLPNVRIGLVTFSETAFIRLKLTSSLNTVLQEANTMLQLGYTTNQAAALIKAEEIFYDARIPSAKYVIMVTDGKPNVDRGQEIVVADRLKLQGARLIMIGVTDQIERSNLRQVAGPQGTVLESSTFRDLGDQVSRIVSSARICPPRPGMCNLPEVAVVLDASGSIRDKGSRNWELLKEFAMDLVTGLSSKRDIRFTFVKFSEDAMVEVPLTSDVQVVTNAIKFAIFLGSYTNHAAALRMAEYAFLEARANSTKYIIMVTDGLPTREQGQESVYARRLREDGVRIIAIGVTNQIDQNKLTDLAGSNGAVFQSQTFTSLSLEVNRVINAASVCMDDPTPICNGPPEIVMILDASGSITDKGSNNWSLMKAFGQRVITSLTNKRNARFAYVRFSAEAFIDVHLTQDVSLVTRTIGQSNHIGGYTSHADALRKAIEVLLRRRQNSTQYVIMVTDGEATWEKGQEFGQADLLKNQGVVIILIGVTRQIDLEELRRLAVPQGYYFTSPTFDQLPSQINSVVRATNLCVQPPTCDVAYVVLAVDTSSSIIEKGPDNSNRMKTFTSQLAGGLVSRYPNMKLALVTFSRTAEIRVTFDQYRSLEDFQQRINTISFLGILTNLADAIRKATNAIVRGSRGSSQIVLITDGTPTAEEQRTEEEARSARGLGIRLITVGVTSQVDRNLLQRISGDAQRSFYSPGFEVLGNQVADVIQVSCNETIPPPPPNCEVPLDIVFVVDASASITEVTAQGWVDARNSLKTVVTDISKRNTGARFAMVVFSTSTRIDFYFQSDSKYVLDLVEDMLYIGQRTNIAEGIKVAREQVFIQARPNSKKVMVVITDGKSNERENQEVSEASLSKSSDITVVAVGVTNSPDQNILRQMATVPERVIRAPNYASLSNEIEQIASAICNIVQPPPPPVTQPPCQGTNIIFLVDDTSRLEAKSPGNFERLKYLLIRTARTISQRHPDAKFGMVTYGAPAHQIASFTYYRDLTTFDTVVRRLIYRDSGTNMAAGLRMVSDMIRGYQGYSQVIILGDGQSTIEPGQETQEAWNIRSQLVRIFAVVVSNTYTTSILSTMLDQPSRLIYALTYNPDDVIRTLPNMLQSCSGAPPPVGPPVFRGPPGAPAPRVIPPVQPQAPTTKDPNIILPIIGQGDTPTNTGGAPANGFPADMALLVDVSSSINRNTWRIQKELLSTLVESFRTTRPDIRFGAITYSTIAKLGFPLTANIDTAKNNINRLRFMNQRTNIAAPLKLARDRMLTSPSRSKVIVLFTDGDPNIDEQEAFNVAENLRAPPYNAKIVAIDITNKGNRTAMERLTGHTDRILMEADSAKLIEMVNRVIKGSKSSNSPLIPVRQQPPVSQGGGGGLFGLIPILPGQPNPLPNNPSPQPAQTPVPRVRIEPFIDNSNQGLQPLFPPVQTPSPAPHNQGAGHRDTNILTTRPSEHPNNNVPTTRPSRKTTRPSLQDTTTRPWLV